MSRLTSTRDATPSASLPSLFFMARFFLQIENGAKAETYLRAGPLALQPNHGDAMADLAVALAMQGPERLQDAMDMLEEAESLGAAGDSFTRRR